MTVAGLSWFLAAAIFSLINEYPGATAGARGIRDLVRDQFTYLYQDRELQKFLVARTLMISTSLAGPVYVALAQREAGQSLDHLGWLMVASGLAGALSSTFWGFLSDRSSRLTMVLAAALAGGLGIAVLAAQAYLVDHTRSIAFYSAVLFILGAAHAGIRIGRKTHIVDLAHGDRKAEYVALSNTLIGIALIFMGVLSGVFMSISLEAAIVALSVLSLLGAAIPLWMKDVQSG